MPKVTKAIIPVAGYGTRFLPATKEQPKEMLTLIDKPVVQYLVEEAVASGIKTILFVINSNKHSIGDHFSRNLELENMLRKKKKKALLESIRHLHKQAEFLYVHQDEPLGSGDAVMRGHGFVGNEPFALFYADDVLHAEKNKPAIGQLIKQYEKYNKTIMGLVKVPSSQSKLYGMISGYEISPRLWEVQNVIEKPDSAHTPSLLASVGRFVTTPDIFRYLPHVEKKGGEFYFSDALAILAKERNVYGYEIDATWYDCGSKLGFYRANVELGLMHEEIGKEAKQYLRDIASSVTSIKRQYRRIHLSKN